VRRLRHRRAHSLLRPLAGLGPDRPGARPAAPAPAGAAHLRRRATPHAPRPCMDAESNAPSPTEGGRWSLRTETRLPGVQSSGENKTAAGLQATLVVVAA
jgi:hypothetical protein